MALSKKLQDVVITAVESALAHSHEREKARTARVNMVREFTERAAEVFSRGPAISGQAAQLLCLTIEALLTEVDGE